MSIELKPELEQRIHAKIKVGAYSDANAVVQDALILLETDHQRINAKKLKNLQEKLAAGLQDLEAGHSQIIKTKEQLNQFFEKIKNNL